MDFCYQPKGTYRRATLYIESGHRLGTGVFAGDKKCSSLTGYLSSVNGIILVLRTLLGSMHQLNKKKKSGLLGSYDTAAAN